MGRTATSTGLGFGWGLSLRAEGRSAAEAAAEQASGGGGTVDLAIVFSSGHDPAEVPGIAAVVRRRLGAAHVIAATAESVVGGRTEAERTSAVSVLSARLPGVLIHPFATPAVSSMHDESEAGTAAMAQGLGLHGDTRCCVMVTDPFSIPLQRLLDRANGLMGRLAEAAGSNGSGGSGPAVIGGLASGARRPGENVLVVDDAVHREGLVGVSLSGPLRVDTIVSQGCRAIGGPMIVTRAKGNMIFELGGRPALAAAKETLEALDDAQRKQLEGGLWLGRAVDASKSRLGRGDFLIRHVVGAEQMSGALAVSDMVRTGQTVQFHLRDGRTAREDLELLLDGQVLHGRPAGALVFTCNGRGTRLFGEPHVDAWTFQRAFMPERGGEERAKPGSAIEVDRAALVPMAGMFAAGEIGPVGRESHIHGQTACFALFREPGG